MADVETASRTLDRHASGWLLHVHRELKPVTREELRLGTGMTPHLLEAGRRLLALATGHEETHPWVTECIESLGADIGRLEEAWDRAQHMLAREQALRSRLRDAAVELNRQLVDLRKATALTLGRSHRDHRSLQRRGRRPATPEIELTPEASGTAAVPANLSGDAPEPDGDTGGKTDGDEAAA